MNTDPIADMLTRIRNAVAVFSPEVEIPKSNLKLEIARILKEEGYIENFRVEETFPAKIIVSLKYFGPRRSRRSVMTSLTRVSKPGRRIYAGKKEIPWVLSGMGIAILTTSQGVMTDQEARRRGIGGEILCLVK